MTRLAVLLPLAAVIWVAFPLAIARFLRGPRTEEREAIGDGICLHGVCPDECPSCRPLPPVVVDAGLPVVLGRLDPQWEADLERFYADYDRYRTELRLPGERAS